MVQLSHPYMATGKTIALTRQTFVSKLMSVFFNMLSRLAIAFLPRSKCLLISWLQWFWSPRKWNFTVSIVSPSICHEMMWPNPLIFLYIWLSFKPAFSLSSFTFIRRLFSFYSLYAIRVVSSAYLRLLIFLLIILIPACASSIPVFHMIYSAYKLNKQGDNIKPWCTPFPIWNQSLVTCPVLTVSSWPACRFLRRYCLLRGTVWYCHLFKNFPQFAVIHSVKGFTVVNDADVDFFFLDFSCFFDDPTNVGSLISDSSLPFLNPPWISGTSQFMYRWSLVWRIFALLC